MEIELKFKVDDHEPIRERLRELGGTCHGKVLEVNHILDDAQGSLLAAQRGLRVRACHDLAGHLISGTWTYKGPPLPGPAKQREEIETQIANPAAALGLLRALGYAEVIAFHKRRESWLLDEAHVELDELPALGLFVEIEAPDAMQVMEIKDLIGLKEQLPIAETYVTLVVQHCSTAGNTPAQLWF
jgi:adenylate cyclase class 2